MSDYIKRYRLEVEIQDNGLIRDPFGWIIGRCDDEWFHAVVRHEPPERPERTCRIGRPIYIDPVSEPPDFYCEFVCSDCGGWVAKGFDYCPNCGAKVVE